MSTTVFPPTTSRSARGPRYGRRGLTAPERRGERSPLVTLDQLPAATDEVLADHYVDGADAEPRSSTVVVPERRRSWSRSVRAMALTAALLATGSGVVALSTNAYFTSSKETQATVAPGTLKFDLLSTANTANPSFSVTNLVPLSASDAIAAAPTTGRIIEFKVRGGSLPTRGVISIATATGSPAALLANVRAQFWVDGASGGRWATLGALDSSALPNTGEFTLAADETKTLKLRLFLDTNTPNALQSGTLNFTLSAKGIQNVAPTGTSY
ncbi:hypothetical protein [Herbiconiux sp. L3-i23]|jgi:predicted ribosomally synthesized peptide with SipW-like signal peptide|uniref:hypothetical protein n=1 Tax=Herbiconiux sp. L3-i23 TaxID=2905871 RepID=UPI002062BDB8|nr:hypothetical protein [Herbiconiux sp. L3-i23]BDI23894.1 hypothetical protein L3i23_26700 [Herbiconiux sp. L3-i23]